jgi:hypothetical protein
VRVCLLVNFGDEYTVFATSVGSERIEGRIGGVRDGGVGAVGGGVEIRGVEVMGGHVEQGEGVEAASPQEAVGTTARLEGGRLSMFRALLVLLHVSARQGLRMAASTQMLRVVRGTSALQLEQNRVGVQGERGWGREMWRERARERAREREGVIGDLAWDAVELRVPPRLLRRVQGQHPLLMLCESGSVVRLAVQPGTQPHVGVPASSQMAFQIVATATLHLGKQLGVRVGEGER